MTTAEDTSRAPVRPVAAPGRGRRHVGPVGLGVRSDPLPRRRLLSRCHCRWADCSLARPAWAPSRSPAACVAADARATGWAHGRDRRAVVRHLQRRAERGRARVDAGTAAMLIQVSPLLIACSRRCSSASRSPSTSASAWCSPSPGGRDIALGDSRRGGHRDLLGVGLCLLSALAYSIAWSIQKPVVGRVPAVQVDVARLHVGARRLPAVRRRHSSATSATPGLVGGSGWSISASSRRRSRSRPTRTRCGTWAPAARRDDLPRAPDHDRDGPGLFLGEAPPTLAYSGACSLSWASPWRSPPTEGTRAGGPMR